MPHRSTASTEEHAPFWLSLPHTFRYNLSSPLPSTPVDFRGVAKHYRLEAQRKNSHDETTEPVSTDRRLVRSRSCVQTSDAASGRARPRAKKRWRSLSKELVSIKLDSDIIAHFQEDGPGWQERINDALRRATGL